MGSQIYIELSVVGAYLVLMALVGYLFRKRNLSSDDYFRGGARCTWWLVGSSALMSAISASVFTGVGGSMFEAGIAPMASNLGILMAHVVLWLGLAAWFRQLRVVTAPETMRERFGPTTQQFYAYLGMLVQPVFGGFQVYALAIFTSAVFHVPVPYTIFIVGAAVGFYSVTGGKWAVMATDFLQSLTLIPVVILVVVLSVIKLGGPAEVLSSVYQSGGFQAIHPEGSFPNGFYTGRWFFVVALMMLINQLQMSWGARFFAAKDGKEANKAAGFLLFAGTVLVFFMFFPPLIARAYFPEEVMAYGTILQKPAEAAYVVVCIELMPSGILGLVLVAMFAATASSMDTGLNTIAGDITRNILPPILRRLGRPPLDIRQELRVGRAISFCLVIFIISIALWMSAQEGVGIFELMMAFMNRVTVPMALPFTLAVFVRSLPRSSAILGIVCGMGLPVLLNPLADQLILVMNSHYGTGLYRDFFTTSIITIVSGLAGVLLSYRLSERLESPGDRAATRAFYVKMHTPVNFREEVGEPDDADQLRLMGRLVLLVSVILGLLVLVPNPWLGRLSILAVSVCVASVGLFMLRAARRQFALQGRLPDPSKGA